MSGFDKIDFASLEKKKAPQSVTATDKPKKEVNSMPKRKSFKFSMPRWAIVAIVVVVLLIGLMCIPAYATYKSGLKTYRQAKLISAAVKTQNVELASEEITKTRESLKETQKNFHYLAFLKFVPVVMWYYNDADHMMKAADHGLESGGIIAESLKPYADVLGLKGQGSFSAGSAEDRIKTAVMTTGKITPQIDKIAVSLEEARKEIDKVNPKHYPKLIFGPKIQTQLTNIRQYADQSSDFINDARPLVKVLPSLLGESEEKKYLVIFQNDKELRPTGGFITAYAIFRIDKGVIKLDRSEDIYKLDDSIPNKQKAPAPILKYLPKVYTFNLRDSNISPDFIESMKTFRSMYEKAGRKADIDGIIALDTSVLVSTIKILDDQVTAGGITFTSKEDSRCDCPQAIYELEDNISRPVGFLKEDRKGLLGDLLQAIMSKALSSSPKIYWGPLFQSFIAETNQKHVLFYLYDKQAQEGIEALNAAGRIRNFDGDYLHINETSFSGAKVNIFVKQEVESNYEVAKDGTITKTVIIRHKNPYPPSNCNLEAGQLCLNAEYRNWFRIYVPKGSELITSKGSQVKLTEYEEFDKTVFDGFLTVRPKGSSTFTITYKLPFKLAKDSTLPVLIQKQPGTHDNMHTIIVNNKKKEEFPLLTDKELNLKVR